MDIYDVDAYLMTDYPSSYETLKMYCCVMCLFLYTFDKSDIQSASVQQLGLSLCHHIFLEFLFHSRNIPFAYHQSEQAVLMFFEYMNQSNAYMIRLNPVDAYRFVLKKTICLIPLAIRHRSLDTPHPEWTKHTKLFTVWYQWCLHIVSHEHEYTTVHQYLLEISNVCQTLEKCSVDCIDWHQEFHELLFSISTPIHQKIASAVANLSDPVNIAMYRKSWLEQSPECEYSLSHTEFHTE